MGSRKQLVLAALVSMGMVLSFAIGLAPSRTDTDVTSATAATGAAAITISVDGVNPIGEGFTIPVGSEQGFTVLSTTDGRLIPTGEATWSLATDGSAVLSAQPGYQVATVTALAPGEAGLYVSAGEAVAYAELTLFDMKAGKVGGTLTEVDVTMPLDGALVYVEEGATNVPLTMTAETDSDAEDQVVSYSVDDNPEGVSETVPYAVTIPDVMAIPKQTVRSIVAVARTYSDYDNPVQDTSFFTVTEIAADATIPPDGLPDDPFALGLESGDLWRASVPVDSTTREVLVVGLGGASKLIPGPVESVKASIQDLENAARVVTVEVPGDLLDEWETGVLILEAADEVYSLIGASKAKDVGAIPEDGLVEGGQYVEVSILVSDDGGSTFAEIDPARLAENPVILTMDGLFAKNGTNARFFSYPSAIESSIPIDITVDPLDTWTPTTLGTTVEAARMTARLDSLSIVAPFYTSTNIQITSVQPPQGTNSGYDEVGINVVNLPPGTMVGDVTVSIAGAAVVSVNSIYSIDSSYRIYVTTPVAPTLTIPATQDAVDVSVALDASNFDVMQGGFTYLGPDIDSVTPSNGTGGITVNVAGEGFTYPLSAKLGGAALISISKAGATYFQGETTLHSPGLVDIKVRNANNYTGTKANAFSYLPLSPVLTSVTPVASAYSDGGYTVRLNGANFVDPETVFKVNGENDVYFTKTDPDSPPFTFDAEAAAVEFLDDTRLNAVTPEVTNPEQYQGVFVETTIPLDAAKYGFSKIIQQYSNGKAFSFLDPLDAIMSIYAIYPSSGSLSGGEEVAIAGNGFPTGPADIMTGTVLRIGKGYGEPGQVVEIPVSVYRDLGKLAGPPPAAITVDIKWDPSVLQPFGGGIFVEDSLVSGWYDPLAVGSSLQGADEIKLAVAAAGAPAAVDDNCDFIVNPDWTPDGDEPYYLPDLIEITTFNDQQPWDVCTGLRDDGEQENPFPLGVLKFVVKSTAKASSTTITPTNLTMAQATYEPLTDAVGQAGFFNIGTSQGEPQPPKVYFGVKEAPLSTTQVSTSQVIYVTSPPGERPGVVDVRIQDQDNLANFAISRAVYYPDEGYEYLPNTVVLNKVTPSQGWAFGGIIARLKGSGFSAGGAGKVSPATQVFFDGESAQIADSVAGTVSTANDLYVIVPPFRGDFAGEDSVDVDVTVQTGDVLKPAMTDEPFTLPDAFTYHRTQERLETVPGTEAGVTYTAFRFDGAHPDGSGPITLELTDTTSTASLTLPQIVGAAKAYAVGDIFGLVRETKSQAMFDMAKAISLPGSPITNISHFDIHLYNGVYPFDELEVDFDPSNPALLAFPTTGSSLTVAQVQAGGVSAYSTDTELDYRDFEDPIFTFGGSPHYQSNLLLGEYTGTTVVTSVDLLRLRTLSAVSLRTGILPRFRLDAIVPTSGPGTGGTAATITGTGLGWPSTVVFGGTGGTITGSPSETAIQVTTPGHVPGLVSVDVTTAAGAGSLSYTYTQLNPIITDIQPPAGVATGGTLVTITGQYLQNPQSVTFGGALGDPLTPVSPTQLTVVTPISPLKLAAPGPVDVTVTTLAGATTVYDGYLYTESALPDITSIDPSEGPATGGTLVTIEGFNIATATNVLFGSQEATIMKQGDQTIQVLSPPSSVIGPVDVLLITPEGSDVVPGGFTYLETSQLVVASVSPASSWLFGGDVAQISGLNFAVSKGIYNIDVIFRLYTSATASVDVAVPILEDRANTSTTLYVGVPELPGIGDGADAEYPVDVIVRQPLPGKDFDGEVAALADGFTYVRYKEIDGVISTAFGFDADTGASEREVVVDTSTSPVTTADLSIPALASKAISASERIYVLARAAKDPAALGTGLGVGMLGTTLGNSTVFDIHLYQGETVADDELLLDEVSPDDATFSVDNPARLAFPVDDASPRLEVDQVQNGQANLWRHGSMLADYRIGSPGTATASGSPGFQSQILLDEYSGDGTNVDTVDARIQQFSFFALQIGDDASPDPAADFSVASESQGPFSGGTRVTLEGSGLGWIETVEFGLLDDGKVFVPATITSPAGSSETTLVCTAPRFDQPEGVDQLEVDIRITTRTGKVVFAAGHFTYLAEEPGICYLIIAAVLALLGLLAGGDGGDGGPCFIATAAYGTPLAAEIDTLRAFRDAYLMNNAIGVAFTDLYYQVSPAIADVIAKSPLLATLVRVMLVPVIFVAKMTLALPYVSMLLVMLTGLVTSRRYRRRRRKA